MKNIFTLSLLLVAVMAELHRREDMSSPYDGLVKWRTMKV